MSQIDDLCKIMGSTQGREVSKLVRYAKFLSKSQEGSNSKGVPSRSSSYHQQKSAKYYISTR